jgi:hypothetical protein
MDVALMTHIEDDLILRGVEDIMQGYSQLYYTKAGAQVATSLRHCMHNIRTKLLTKLPQLRCVEVLKMHGVVDTIKQGGGRAIGFIPGLDILS